MVKVSNEELSKIAQFIASCDDMINGKFILADVKITKVLNMIANSEELYRYISECMVGFDFGREYHRAEVKNGLNGGVFAVPSDPQKLVAFVFCILVECDAKRLDFYNFINENFGWESKSNAYKNFAEKLLTPFKEIISSHFGLISENTQNINDMADNYRQDLMSDPIFEDNKNKTNFGTDSFAQMVDYENINGTYAKQTQMFNQQAQESSTLNENSVYSSNEGVQNLEEIQNIEMSSGKEKDIWSEICDICENIESSVYAERHLKEYLKEELLYIVKTIKYSTKYRDVKIISALVTAFDELTKKFRSIQFVFGELKNKLENLY